MEVWHKDRGGITMTEADEVFLDDEDEDEDEL